MLSHSHSHKRPQAQANYLSAEGYWGRRKGGSATKDLSGAGRKNVVGETACGLQRKIPRRGEDRKRDRAAESLEGVRAVTV